MFFGKIGKILAPIGKIFAPKRESSGYTNPGSWLVDWFRGGERSSSGVSVTRESALTYAAWWRGINRISQDVATLPLVLYKRGENDDVENAREHPAYMLCKYDPNDLMTSQVIRQTMQADALSCGSGYAFIDRNNGGDPIEIFPLPAMYTLPKIIDGKWLYESNLDGTIYRFQPNDVLHIKGLSPNGMMPYSVFDKARESLGLGLAARNYGSTYFKNNAKPSIVLEHPGKLSPVAKESLREMWQSKFSQQNAFSVAVAEEGMKANPLSISNSDAQFLETRKFEIREIANWLGLPPHFLGDDSKTAYASLEQENQSYLDGCLNSWLVMWESELRKKLLTEQQKRDESHYFEFTRQALLRANMVDRYRSFQIAVGQPFLTPNEARKIEGLNPIEGGDDLAKPLNMGNPGGDPNATPSDPPQDDSQSDPKGDNSPDAPAKARIQVVVSDAVKRAVKRIAFHARNAGGKPDKFLAFVDGFKSEHRATLIEMILPSVGLVTDGDSPIIHERAACITSEFLDMVHDELLALSGECKANDLQSRVAACMDAHEQFTIETITRSIMEYK